MERPRRVDEPRGQRARLGARASTPRDPTRSASTSTSRVGRSVTAPTATRASTTAPSSSRVRTQHAIDCAKSPWRSANSSNALVSGRRRAARRSRRRAPPARASSGSASTKKSSGGDLAAAARAVGDDGAAERDEAERQLAGAVGVRDRPADRAAVPRHDVPDVRQRRAHERWTRSSLGERRLPHRRAEAQRAVLALDRRRARRGSGRRAASAARAASLSAGTRLWPPAIGFASSPPSASAASASSSEPART